MGRVFIGVYDGGFIYLLRMDQGDI